MVVTDWPTMLSKSTVSSHFQLSRGKPAHSLKRKHAPNYVFTGVISPDNRKITEQSPSIKGPGEQ